MATDIRPLLDRIALDAEIGLKLLGSGLLAEDGAAALLESISLDVKLVQAVI